LPRAALVAVLLALTLWALLSVALGARGAGDPLTDDERDYLRAAAHLARSGTLSVAPVSVRDPAPDAYREPGYPALLALAWRVAAAPLPADEGALERTFETPRLGAATRAVGVLLLTLAVAAAGWSVGRLATARAGALAAALVAASPALHARAVMAMSETLLAAHLALVGTALAAWVRGSRRAAAASLALVAVLPLVRAEGAVIVGVAAGVAALCGSGSRWRRVARGALFAAVALLPALLWMERNRRAVGHFTMGDRAGLALATRAAIDRDVGRSGLLQPLLAWTPSARAQRLSRARGGGVDYLDYSWGGGGNFFSRTVDEWRTERGRPGADPLAVDAAFARRSLRRFAAHPLEHLEAGVAVAWRGLFAERSPAWSRPVDLGLAFGLLLAVAMAWVTGAAVARRDGRRLALLAPAWALFLFQVAATEFLPRYGVPLLPLAWGAVALALAGRGPEFAPRD